MVICSTLPGCEAVGASGSSIVTWNPNRDVETAPSPEGIVAVAMHARPSKDIPPNIKKARDSECPDIHGSTLDVGNVKYEIFCTSNRNALKDPVKTMSAEKNLFECLALCSSESTCRVIAPTGPTQKCSISDKQESGFEDDKGESRIYWVARAITRG